MAMTVHGMTVRGMTVRGMTVRGMTVRGMTVRGNWMHRKPSALPSSLSTYFSPPFI
jgi:hypothetical protein